MNPHWQVKGGKELAQFLDSLRPRVSRRLQYEALMAGAKPIRDEAQRRAPFDPVKSKGAHLQENQIIRYARDPNGGNAAAVAVGPAKWTWWGAWQEWGTAHHKAQPYLRPAFDQMVRKAIDLIAGSLRVAIMVRGGAGSGRASGGGIGDVIAGPKAPTVSGGPRGGLL